VLSDVLDRAILAGCISTFKDDQNLFVVLNEVSLQLNQLNLKIVQALLINFSSDSGGGVIRVMVINFSAHG
jgi:hypothetical protein